MKAVYIKPEIETIVMLHNEQLLSDSTDEIDFVMARRNNHFSFSSWDDEEPDNSLPRSKSVWDD